MVTAGRTVLFSATIVRLCRVATVAFAAAAALIVTPAVIVSLGDRLNALKIRGPFRRSAAAYRVFGLGLTLAVLTDATPVEMILMPAFKRVLGEWNSWAPGRLTRRNHRLGLNHYAGATTVARSGQHIREPFGTECRI
ncbi:hypothetical protein TUM20983_23910 [Mycobacterium antarcticum]|nr:hypothetical protein TUM20983_23910 [Mycolicibacterium sp. TUM20983]